MLELTAGDAVAVVDAAHGGRIRQLSVGGNDLLVDDGKGLYDWGLFPMVPFAGRIRRGRFEFRGRAHQLPAGAPPHAIHGTLLGESWNGDGAGDAAELWTTLDRPWPFKGEVRHDVRLEPGGLRLQLRVRAAETMPVTVGWHPWWRRRLAQGGPAQLEVSAGRMYQRDREGIPTGELVRPHAGPWDDCFTDLRSSPTITWPGALRVTMEHSCDHLVVYDEPDDSFCVEPQSGPPDAVNLGLATVVRGGDELAAQLRIRWEPA